MARGGRHPRMFNGRRLSPVKMILAALLAVSAVLLVLLALGTFLLPVDSEVGSKAEEKRNGAERGAVDGSDLVGAKGLRLSQFPDARSVNASLCRSIFASINYISFQSRDECEYLIELAKPHMMKSTVVDSTTGKSKDSRVRTSSGMFLRRGQDKIIQKIEKRIADFTFIPVEHGEGLQVLHYEVGQKYEPHFDYFLDEYNTKNGGQRMATLLMYLSDVEEGGETIFPSAKVNSSSLPGDNELLECGKRGLSVKPRMGDALLFWSMRPDATLDPSSLHGGCPVIRGNKWSSTKWIHVQAYRG